MKTLFILALLSLNLTNNPPSDSYSIDNGHSYIGFDVERFMVGEVSGRFNKFFGIISVADEDLTTLDFDVNVDVESLDSNNEIRDGHLKGEQWLNAYDFPSITFKSSKVSKIDAGNYSITGKLKIKNIENEITFPAEILGPFIDPGRNKTIGFKANIVINRMDYNISFNKTMDNGSLFIEKEVKIKIRVLAIKNK